LSIYFENAGAIWGNEEDMANIGRLNLDESLPLYALSIRLGKIDDMI